MTDPSADRSPLRRLASPAYWWLRRLDWPLTVASRRLRRALLLGRLRLAAAWRRVPLAVDLAPDVILGRRIRVDLSAGGGRLVLGPRTAVGDDVLVRLRGGVLEVGPDCDIRSGVVLNVSGDLVLEGRNVLSHRLVIHCEESVRVGAMTIVGEHVTIADSRHVHVAPDRPVHHDVEARPVVLGRNCWVCAGAVVTMGTTVGSFCVIGANATVRGTVPDGHIAVGVPATTRPLRLPFDVADHGPGADA